MKFIYMQSIVEYRIPINEDGSLGSPQIVNKWTKEKGAPKYKKPKTVKKTIKKTIKKIDAKAEIGEVTF